MRPGTLYVLAGAGILALGVAMMRAEAYDDGREDGNDQAYQRRRLLDLERALEERAPMPVAGVAP